MRGWLICTHKGEWMVLEEIMSEGAVPDAIERHVERYNEEHRAAIRVCFPEAEFDAATIPDWVKGMAEWETRRMHPDWVKVPVDHFNEALTKARAANGCTPILFDPFDDVVHRSVIDTGASGRQVSYYRDYRAEPF